MINIGQSHFWSFESVEFNILTSEQSYFWTFESVKYCRSCFRGPCQRTQRLEIVSSFFLQWHEYVCLLSKGKTKKKLMTDFIDQACYWCIGLDNRFVSIGCRIQGVPSDSHEVPWEHLHVNRGQEMHTVCKFNNDAVAIPCTPFTDYCY